MATIVRSDFLVLQQIPPMKWAQRKESVFITLMIVGVSEPEVHVTASSLTFS